MTRDMLFRGSLDFQPLKLENHRELRCLRWATMAVVYRGFLFYKYAFFFFFLVKLESSEKREPPLKDCLYQIVIRQVCRVFSWSLTYTGNPSFPTGQKTWLVYESKQ